jgi:hypothetical protein
MNRLPRLAYLTTDPSNAATVEALAATYRLELAYPVGDRP